MRTAETFACEENTDAPASTTKMTESEIFDLQYPSETSLLGYVHKYTTEELSKLIHEGPGWGSMLDGLQIWARLAWVLTELAHVHQAVLWRLSAVSWWGTAAETMITAIQDYLLWLTDTAAAADHARRCTWEAAQAYDRAVKTTASPGKIESLKQWLQELERDPLPNAGLVEEANREFAEMRIQIVGAMQKYLCEARTVTTAMRSKPFTNPSEVVLGDDSDWDSAWDVSDSDFSEWDDGESDESMEDSAAAKAGWGA